MEIRPIDANALQFKQGVLYDDQGFSIGYVSLRQSDIDAAPTLDYAPVMHGEWIEKIEPYAYTASGREIHIFHCSVCDFTWANKRMVFDHFKHCPNCGAKMDLKEE